MPIIDFANATKIYHRGQVINRIYHKGVILYESPPNFDTNYTNITLNVADGQTLKVANISSGSVTELYIDGVSQTPPTGTSYTTTTAYAVGTGKHYLKIKGSFSLYTSTVEMLVNNLQPDLTNLSYAFYSCSKLLNVPAIPSNITNLTNAFTNCNSLNNISISVPNACTTCKSIFYGCTGLTNIASVRLSGDTYGAFINCSNLTTINNLEFYNATLSSSSYPPFNGCTKLTNIGSFYLTGTNPNATTRQNLMPKTLTTINQVASLPSGDGNYLFYNCSALTSVGDLTGLVIGTNMFNGCSALVNPPTLPNTLTTADYMFYMCSSLVNPPTLNNGLLNCSQMFRGCISLTSTPTIPSTVNTATHMFNSCTSLDNLNVYVPDNCSCNYIFYGCTGLTRIIYARMNGDTFGIFNNCSNLTQVDEIIFNNVTLGNVSYAPFTGCTKLTIIGKLSITGTNPNTTTRQNLMPKAIITINEIGSLPNGDASYLFYNCTAFNNGSVILPNGITNMSYTFSGCTSLTNAKEIQSTVTNCSYTYNGCTGLYNLPQQNIDYMFSKPAGMTTITGCYRNCTNINTTNNNNIVNNLGDPLVYANIPTAWK